LTSKHVAPAALAALAAALGCGSNNASVPQALLDAIEKPTATGAYPKGPYGTREGDVIEDHCFSGWRDPKAASYDPGELSQICFSDFHGDPDARLLLVESCAIWCAACRTEYGGDGAARPSLGDRLAQRKSEGFRILGTIFQNVQSKPATPADAAAWAKVYSIDFPFAVDSDDHLARFASSAVAPFNVLVDARTMKVVLELEGDEPSILFTDVDHFLGATGP
jgi:hypothetical protein